MTREQAEKASLILKLIKDFEGAKSGIRRLHKAASGGDQESLDKLANIAFELADNLARELEEKLRHV